MLVKRYFQNPIIRPEMLPGSDGTNINGPSLIRVPEWLPEPLGRYYLYFAHHNGTYIRMAYADTLAGPWKIYAPGTLQLADAPGCYEHIASPDVHVDTEARQVRMYFHGPAIAGGGQLSFVATSPDGLHFSARPEPIGFFYFRVFRWDSWWYALAKGGLLHRSRDGQTPFAQGPDLFPGGEARTGDYNEPGPRHVAVRRVGETLEVYYTNIGDAPERIFRAIVPLTPDWHDWKPGEPVEILRPEYDWEGANLPAVPSTPGGSKRRENALRDPAIFTDADGKTYLLYSIAGEAGIAIAELTQENTVSAANPTTWND
ncbi:MAG: hypothetical protein OHK0029_30660 [Armatimonadaceae bacterium]